MTRAEQSDIRLRSLSPDDFPAWQRAFAERHPRLSAHDDGPVAACELTSDRHAELLARYGRWADDDAMHVLGVFAVATSELVGWIDLTTLARDERQWANLGFHVHNQFQQRGYGRAAVAAAVRHAFEALGHYRVEAAIRLDNPVAIHTVESAGLERECVRRRFWHDVDGWTDHVIYVAIAD